MTIHINTFKFLATISLLLFLGSCASSNETILAAKSHLDTGEYDRAIKILENNPNKASRKFLIDTYVEYGIDILKGIDDHSKLKDVVKDRVTKATKKKTISEENKEKYNRAKSQFEKALALDPKNKIARDLYQMIIKLQIFESNH